MGVLGTVKRELAFLDGVRRLRKWTGDVSPDSSHLVADDFEDVVDKFPNNIAFRFKGELTSYSEFDKRACQYANWALAQGLTTGDCVALFMGNCPDYVACWSGLSKIGIVVALINSNLESKGLAHCVNIAQAKHLIAGAEQADQVHSAESLFHDQLKVWSLGGPIAGAERLETAFEGLSTDRPSREYRADLSGKDLCLYVYTSGTTGLPKAARLTQARTQGMMRTFIGPCKITPRDRIYITLPLYHGTGGLCGVGQALMTGATIILRDKFSTSDFWREATEEGATAFVYIGELCRYLLNTPEHPMERSHSIRTGFGNGLRPEVWQKFKDRFGIPHLCEFYGSTEGNVSFLNFDGKVGAIGRIPNYMRKQMTHKIVKFDLEVEEPIRGEDGFCMEADIGEAGEAIGEIVTDTAAGRFEGYNDEEQTKKKILTDVFAPGDKWFRTGDLLKRDEDGYFYFVDRIGDTFRWKAENVSTNEVGEVLSVYQGISTANVYGVEVPGMDGRAGMAAITTNEKFDLSALWDHLANELPTYARPIFLRVQKEAETTGTFKYRKVELVQEGFDPDKVEGETVYFAHPQEGKFVELDRALYDEIVSGAIKL